MGMTAIRLAVAMSMCFARFAFSATLTVSLNTDTNSGGAAGTGAGVSGDLRDAIRRSGAGDTIVFACGTPCTVLLSGPLPPIAHDLIIDGAGGVTGNAVIDGAGQFRVFFVDTGNVMIRNLQIQNAMAKGGHG